MKRLVCAGCLVVLLCAAMSAQKATTTRNVNLRPDPSTDNDPIEKLKPPAEVTLAESDSTNGFVLDSPVPASLDVALPAVQSAVPESGWWWDPKLSGMGFFIEHGGKSGGGLFIAVAGYDDYGGSLWLVSTGPLAGSTYGGTWLLAKDGGSFSQRAIGHLSLTPAGDFSIQFTDASHAVMMRSDGSQINLQRFSFTASKTPAPSDSGTPQSGWWWAERNADGNAFAIEIQNDSVFVAAFSYGDFGDPFWCLASGSLTSPTTFSGNWDFFEGGPQFNAPEGTYAAHKDAFGVAPMTLTFTDATHATMTYRSGSTTVSLPIVRFQEF